MIDWKFFDDAADEIVENYMLAESDIINDMAERIAAFDFYGTAVQYQEQKLQEMGYAHQYILTELSRASGKSVKELEQIIKKSGAEVLAQNVYLKSFGLQFTEENASEVIKSRLAMGLKKTSMLFENLTNTTARTATKQLENALDRAYMQIETGAFSYNEAIRRAVKKLSADGVQTVEYHNAFKTKKTDQLDVAVRRAVLTGVNQTTAELQLAVNEELGLDLVEVSAHAGARPEHAEWQGKIYSLSGTSKKYKDFYAETGYGTGAGLCGWNCRHTFYPYVEGANRVWTNDQLNKLNEETVTYNGKKHTEYDASQIQRGIERNIRKYKREAEALKAAGLSNDAERAKVNAWNRKLNDFTEQTGFKKQYDRTFVDGYSKSPTKIAQKSAPKIATQAEKEKIAKTVKTKSEIVQKVKSSGVARLETKRFDKQPTEQEIIARLGGRDRTKGSCSSLAFAYAGNKQGIDVLDFRGGDSCEFFSRNVNIHEIMKLEGVNGKMYEEMNDFVGAHKCLENVEVGKQYYFRTGKHAAIVRKNDEGLQYLELQSSEYSNGWQALDDDVLSWRFGCQKSHTSYGTKYPLINDIVEIDNLKGDDFEELLNYINTAPTKQKKGAGGGIK